jgi:hypothetical protein
MVTAMVLCSLFCAEPYRMMISKGFFYGDVVSVFIGISKCDFRNYMFYDFVHFDLIFNKNNIHKTVIMSHL